MTRASTDGLTHWKPKKGCEAVATIASRAAEPRGWQIVMGRAKALQGFEISGLGDAPRSRRQLRGPRARSGADPMANATRRQSRALCRTCRSRPGSVVGAFVRLLPRDRIAARR